MRACSDLPFHPEPERATSHPRMPRRVVLVAMTFGENSQFTARFLPSLATGLILAVDSQRAGFGSLVLNGPLVASRQLHGLSHFRPMAEEMGPASPWMQDLNFLRRCGNGYRPASSKPTTS